VPGNAARVELADGTTLGCPPQVPPAPTASRWSWAPGPSTWNWPIAGASVSEVVVVEPTGADTFVACRHHGTEFSVVFRERHDFAPGSTIHLQPDLQRAHLFDAGQRPAPDLLIDFPSGAARTPHHRAKETRMNETNRRKFLEGSAGVAAGRRWAPWAHAVDAAGSAQAVAFKPEKGAKLRVLRWSRFVQGDIDAYMANVKKFTEKTGVEVRVDNEGWEDVRPKAAVAANTGAGPDIILSTNDDANLYPEKLLDVTDLCHYLGKKYGGWYPACEAYLQARRQEVDRRAAGRAGAMLVYRESHMKAAGFDAFPKDTAAS
jgi:hypothetical protein